MVSENEVVLYGYSYSVYARTVKLALLEKALRFRWIEIDPFDDDCPQDYLKINPFKRVPALVHGSLVLFETRAICGYIDEDFEGPPLQPRSAKERARMEQIIAVVDHYGYWPLVRQVASHEIFRPLWGEPVDRGEIHKGYERGRLVLETLEGLASGGPYLTQEGLSLADLHLAPMIGYFALSEKGAEYLDPLPRLSAWWQWISQRESVVATTPVLPERP